MSHPESAPVQWPKGYSPAPQSPGLVKGERCRVLADLVRLQVGNQSFPIGNSTVEISNNKPVVLKNGEMRLELWIPSWIQGSFDPEITLLFGEFCRAALNRDGDRMRSIASRVRQMLVFEYVAFIGGTLGATVLFCWGIFRGWPEWILFLTPLVNLVGCFYLRERNRQRLLKM